MEDVAGDDDQCRCFLDHGVDGVPNRPGDIGFALVVSCRTQPLILAEAEVQVSEMGNAHAVKLRER